jgi:hypothetical protein
MQRAQQRTAKDDLVFPAEFLHGIPCANVNTFSRLHAPAQALRRKFLYEDSSVEVSLPLKNAS